ncbi:hypothetical protein HPHPH45_1110 [Helicobacter pylori Hp H-45]|uniref:Uncharacterized protein n=1 Tax=Helicobacter pylori Hp H-45 TaxID=992050 RepID=J0LYD7_HELPX|nr:hypothetical protein HPHPH45_1110 [Helicobacter pylori Hp H-45]
MEREYLFQSAPNLQVVKIFVLYSKLSNGIKFNPLRFK